MSYADRDIANKNDAEYAKLVVLQARAEEVVQNWVDRTLDLRAKTADTADKAELVTLRNAFSASLQTILGL